MAKKKIVPPSMEEVMASFNGEIAPITEKYLALLPSHAVYVVLFKMADDIYRHWRSSLNEEHPKQE